LFERVVMEDTYEKYKAGWVADWKAVPIEEVVDKMIQNRKVGQHQLRKFYPNVIKKEFKRREVKI